VSIGCDLNSAPSRILLRSECAINVGKATIDMMVFDTTARAAYLSRGPSYKTAWRTFTFTAKQ
jgi:hypothetical protein